jgi:hypothetical protein
MRGRGAIWAFLGLPGLRELILVALVTLVLYGRSGLVRARQVRTLRRWATLPRRPSPSSGAAPKDSKLADRCFWVLAITAATAVAAWIVTRMVFIAPP